MSPVDVISFAPRFGALPGLRRRVLAAWLKDRDWAGVDVRQSTWLRTRQAELVRGADVVSGVSTALVEDCRRLGVGAVRIPNGCDVARFEPRPEPRVWRDIPRPRVVFAGAWNERVDTALVAALAAELPGISFVVVGEVRAALPDAANVHVLGAVGFDELPAHLQAADVGIVPYRPDRFNAASCPLKVYEYLAAGLPVVATAVDTGDLPTDLVRRADGLAAFTRAVAELAGRDVRARCRAVAAANSWDARADALLEELDRA
jgi:glycosyltransferase involved in cell wall biosynthesis